LGQTACAQSNTAADQAPAVFEKSIQNKGQLVDVRTPAEFAAGHLPGAVNIDIYGADFEKRLAALDKNAPLYLYCRSGGRSGQALALARSLGFKKAVHLQGGILAWEAAGKKTVK
jgi:rhodanese-related sulfurtransferase